MCKNGFKCRLTKGLPLCFKTEIYDNFSIFRSYHNHDKRLPIFKHLKSMKDTGHLERKIETIDTLKANIGNIHHRLIIYVQSCLEESWKIKLF